MTTRGQPRPPLPDGLTAAERAFVAELRRAVDLAGLTTRALEELTSTVRTADSEPSLYSKSQWDRWLNGKNRKKPPLQAIRRLATALAAEGIDAGELLRLWHATFESDSGSAPPWQVPAASPHLVGRAAELAALDDLAAHAADGDGTVVVVIAGTAGVGKSALANRFSQRARDQFPDGQLYVNLRGFDPEGQPLDASAALRGFLEALGERPSTVPATEAAQAGLFRSLVAGKRLLIVCDNARGVGQVRPLIPAGPGCLVLVTSRNELAGLLAQGAQALTLAPFTPGDALEFLTRRLTPGRVEREPRAAEELIRLCAGLPLAMSVVAARAAAHPDFPLAALAGELAERGLDRLETGDPQTSARAVFSWSYQYLNAPAARMFRLLGSHPGPDTSVTAAASLAGVTADQARAALGELARAHLAEEHAPGRFAVHDLLRAYAAEQARATDSRPALREAELRMLDHYLHTALAGALLLEPSRECGELPSPRPGVLLGRPAAADADEDDAIAWFTAEHQPLLAASARAAARGFGPHCWLLPWAIARYLTIRGHWLDFAATQRGALAAADRLGDLRGLGHAHYQLGYALHLIGGPGDSGAAESHVRQALDLFTRTADHGGQSLALHGLAQLFEARGRYTEALPIALEALRLRAEHSPAAAVARSEAGVGAICARLERYQEAIAHGRRALAASEEAGTRMHQAEALNILGFAYTGLGDHASAIDCYQQAVAICRELGGLPFLAATLTSLGDAQTAVGDEAAAQRSRTEVASALDRLPPASAEQVRAWLSRESGAAAVG